jgi:hypothetical protein
LDDYIDSNHALVCKMVFSENPKSTNYLEFSNSNFNLFMKKVTAETKKKTIKTNLNVINVAPTFFMKLPNYNKLKLNLDQPEDIFNNKLSTKSV